MVTMATRLSGPQGGKSEEVEGGQGEECGELWGLCLVIRQSTLKLECLGYFWPHVRIHLKLQHLKTHVLKTVQFFLVFFVHICSHPREQTQQCV